ncbi:hypothetical protein FRC15_002605 [Serendipita sp. 397]|nr:hypothetical protein FRC15_002605 [Serendipita sp. 397]KAG8800521.1 hypothetical protein FRC16_002710 [Serendipita sp. 398]
MMPLKSFRTSPLSSHLFPPSQPTPRRSPYAYANLLSQIAEPLRNVVAGEAGQELPLESDATEMVTESVAEAEDTGPTLQLNNLQNCLQGILACQPHPSRSFRSRRFARPQ